jgi:hypothetical protein
MPPENEEQFWEERFQVLKDQARVTGRVTGKGTQVAGGPMPPGPRAPGYYGLPVVKPPVWTWEVPLYFFVGGIAGMSGVLAFGGLFLGEHLPLARAAIWIAFAGALISTVLLVKDLGRPSRFYNMLRVFKWRSAMSVGSWLLAFFGGAAMVGAVLMEWHYRTSTGGRADSLLVFAGLFTGLTAVLGALLATYTGVLISATAVPAWFSHRATIPFHFGVTGLGSAAAVLELLGFIITPLHAIGFLAAGIETLLAAWIEFGGKGAADRSLREGFSGWLIRISGLLTGPSAVVLRAFGLIHLAAGAFLLGALINRYGWLQAGRVSARDPQAVFAAQRPDRG